MKPYSPALNQTTMNRNINVTHIIYTLVLTLVVNNLLAQQPNKPQTAQVVAPTVRQMPAAYGTNLKVNYVRTWEANGPITDPNALPVADYRDVLLTTQYVDGLGRPLQIVSRRITPGSKDMVSPVYYDEFGREAFKYLPYASPGIDGSFKPDPFAEQKTFMQGQFSDEQVYYSQVDYEASPLNRVVKSMAPGNSWAGSSRGIAMEYIFNTANEAVRIWNIGSSALSYNRQTKDVNINIPFNPATPASTTYNAGELYKNVTKDESGNAIVEYKDKEGLVILKKVQVGNIATDYSGYTGFLCTYYVYDDYSRLRFVIPPKAVTQLIGYNWQFTNDIINELCFRYEYDDLGRMIAKKVPGAGWVYMVYDVRDRLVFTQDANMSKNNQWLTTLYDGLNRPVITGVMSGYTGNREALQNLVTSQKAVGGVPPGMVADLVLPNAGQTSPFSGLYQAGNSVRLDPGFESVPNATFIAEIASAPGVDIPEESVVEGITVNKNPLSSNVTFVALSKTYYDNYDWTSKDYKADYNNKMDAGGNAHALSMPTVKNTQTAGLVTGSQVRVITDPANLATGNWLTTVSFYDDHNRVIQVNSETQKGIDIITNLYDFTGKVLCSYLDHKNPTATPAGLFVKTSMNYDHTGRLLEVWKTINDDAGKKALIVKNEYDELGQLKVKELGHKKDDNGNYTTMPYDALETLSYSYNIRGWLAGINKEYSKGLAAPNGVDPWFGMELNYDKGFQVPQYNGNIAGAKWRSAGDGERRAFGYTYDQAGRILGADFCQVVGADYTDHPTIQFDMEMGNTLRGFPAYDENGNIGAMKHKGLKLGNSQVIDELVYDYHNGGNKLKYVKDWATDASGTVGGSWGLGDFTDNNPDNPNKNDYGYDVNGNMVVDLNKKMTGTPDIDQAGGAITYNHLNLPWKIQVDGGNKGNITYVYDAAGKKLSKVVEDKSIAGKIVTTTTNYIGGLVYESKATNPADPVNDYTDKLQLISHEEGRIRYIAAKNNVAAHFEYDYLVKDHLGNTRVVLTEEKGQHDYMATMEKGPGNAVRNVENQLFSNLDASEFPTVSVPDGYPTGNSATDPNEYVAKVNGSTNKKGPAIVLKVMTGDVVDFRAKYFYRDKTNPGGTVNVVSDILSSLAGGIVNASGVTKGTLGELSDPGGPLQGALTAFRNENNPDNPGKPRAYLNWILVDEQFKYVNTNGQSGALQVENHDEVLTLYKPEFKIEKSGYLYIYVSNETEFWDVYFDDLKVTHSPGALLEETHYYPFGLTMAGISSKAINIIPNKYKYNGIEHNADLDLNMYDAYYRNLDPQIGRFWQVDPEFDNLEQTSPYESMGNNPIGYTDPLGNFRSRFGAWLNKLFHGGGSIAKNENGEWYVNKTRTEPTEDGNATIVSYKYYGKGRNQYTAAAENIQSDQEQKEFEDHLVKKGVLERTTSRKEANEKNLKAFVGVLLPNPLLKSGTSLVNRAVVPIADKIKSMGFKELQKAARSYSIELNAFFMTYGGNVASKEALLIYKELATRMLSGTGGAYQKVTKAAEALHTERIMLIDQALDMYYKF